MKKNVMFMVNGLYGGGAEKVLQTILNNINSNKYNITLYSMHREHIDKSRYLSDFTYKVVFDTYTGHQKIKKIYSSIFDKIRGWIFNNCSSKLFYRLFIHGKYDVEIAFIEGESTKIIAGSTNEKSKKIAWVHIDLLENPWTDFLYKDRIDEQKHYLIYDKIICVSDSVRHAFSEKYGINNNVVVLYNPYDKEEIIKKSNEQIANVKGQSLRLISVGRLEKQKGYDRLISIAEKLKKNGFQFNLIILGEGTERSVLEQEIAEYGLKDQVKLIGYVDNPYGYIKNSDLFVCSSRSEGFSTVVAESIILGIPVISTRCAGTDELFGNYKCGIIVDNTEEALYKGLQDIFLDKSKLFYFKNQCFQRGNEFSLTNTMLKIEGLIDE